MIWIALVVSTGSKKVEQISATIDHLAIRSSIGKTSLQLDFKDDIMIQKSMHSICGLIANVDAARLNAITNIIYTMIESPNKKIVMIAGLWFIHTTSFYEKFTSRFVEEFKVKAYSAIGKAYKGSIENCRMFSAAVNHELSKISLSQFPSEIVQAIAQSLTETDDSFRLETTHLFIDLLGQMSPDVALGLTHEVILNVLLNTFGRLSFQKSFLIILDAYSRTDPNVRDFRALGGENRMGLDTLFSLMLSEQSDVRKETRKCMERIAPGENVVEVVAKVIGDIQMAVLGKKVISMFAKEGLDEAGMIMLKNFVTRLKGLETEEGSEFRTAMLKLTMAIAADKSNAFQKPAGELLASLLH